ncbi:MAG: molybdopterin-dependent oxidoreductase [Minwuia sp.]|uniref:molybdopterin-dependent oxidoreductase n=1 Tax=Minwuia sp. TaxID=2493630 RepID=UPI003A86D31E
MNMSRLVPLVVCASLIVLAAVAMADGLSAPTGKVILTVAGKDVVANTSNGLELDAAQFAALPRTSLITVTPFMDGEQDFEGVLLSDLMGAAGIAFARDIRATALDDYAVTIPAIDMAGVGILVADRQNGAPLDPDGMGPLWIIYPADAGVPDAQDKMIWQLRSLTVQ